MRHRKCPNLSLVAAAIAAAFAGVVNAQQAVLPTSPTVASGQVSVSSPGARQLVVNQQSNRAVVNWNSFSMGAGTQVDFVQPGSNSAILNRVTGATPSSIAGQINANGQVFLVNPNGIEITPTGTVRAAGATLSTLDIADADFLSGRLSFVGGGASAAVSNRGSIVGTSGGFAALLGGQVANDGRIEVPMGRIGVGAGERATLDLLGSRFLQVAMPTASTAEGRALVEVAGSMSAQGGRIEISAATARETLRQAVNIPGSLDARSVAGHRGDIVLSAGSGGSAMISGTLDASGADTTGGSVTVTGDSITLQRARIDASGAAGGGDVLLGGGAQGQGPLPRARQLQVGADAVVNADAARDGAGGRVVLWSDVQTDFRGTLSARGAGAGTGGSAEVSSAGRLDYSGRADLRAERGAAGTLLLDPFDVTISAGADTGPCCTATSNSTVINTTTLANALASANVTVSTGGGGAQSGDITVASPVTWNSGNALTLNAARDINVNAAVAGSGSLQLNAGRNIAVTNNVLASGGPLNVALTASASGGSVSIVNATIDTGGGNLAASATQPGGATGLVLSNATLNVGSGAGTLAGRSGSAAGIFLMGNVQAHASGSGSLTLDGVSTSGNGLMFANNASLGTTGGVTLSGTSGSATGIFLFGATTLNVASGALALHGSSANNMGVWFNDGGNITLVATGGLSIDGTSTIFRGLGFGSNVSVAATGNIDITGTATSERGLWFNSTNTMSASNGTLSLTGNSSSSDGAFINFGANSFTQSGTGAIVVSGNSATGHGMLINSGVALGTSGKVTLSGSTGSAWGVSLGGGSALTASSGSLAISGASSTSSGVQFSGVDSLTNAGGSITVTGSSSTGPGVALATGAAVTTAGDMTLSGSASASGGRGVQFNGAALTVASGSLALTGSSLDSSGIVFVGAATSTVTNNGTGLTMAGSSNTGPGVFMSAGHVLRTTGDVTLSGSGSSTGISLASGATVDNTGSGTLHLVASTGGIDLGSDLVSPSGALWLTSAGDVVQGSGSVNASQLLLSGPGAYTLEAAGNQLQTMAANSGTTSLHSATDLTVGSVLGTSGATSSGALTLRSDGNLTIAAGMPVNGASPVLAAGAAFINNAGPGAVTATSGRWLVYAADPATSSFGGLDSGNTALWNASYALTPPAGVSAGGNRYLFGIQPTLSFAPLDATKVYGDDATGAIQSSFTVAGFHAGVSNAFLADTAATAYSGAALASSPGAGTSAGVAGGPYALSLSQGSLSSTAGYAFAFPGVANLTVTPRPITVSASSQDRWYGDPNPPLTYMVSSGNLVNADTLAGGLDTAALGTSPVGTYGIGQGTLSAGANYALSYVPASLNVWPRPTPVNVGMPTEFPAQPATAPSYGGFAGQDFANGWKNGSVTPADPARYIVLMVDDVAPPGSQFLLGGLAGRGQLPGHLQAGGAAQVMAALERQHHLQRVATWPIPSMAVVCVLYRLPDGRKPEELLAVLRNDQRVRAADQLQEFTPLEDPGVPRYNDPYVDMQRGFAEIAAAGAHRLSTGRRATVAVVDTAVDLGHPVLAGRIAVSRDMVATGSRAEPQQSRHGTEVVGIIAASANNGQGIVGIAPAAEINAYRACWYPAASTAARCNSFTLAKALADVLQSGARIVNLSLGGPADSVLELLLRRLVADGRIVVAALPLSGRAEGFPAGVPGVLVVASNDKGPLPSNVLVAPGRDLLTLVPGGRYDFSSGSSLAAAHVSGAVALLLSMDPALTADEVRKLLSDSATSPSHLINAEAAVTSLGKQRQYSLTSQH